MPGLLSKFCPCVRYKVKKALAVVVGWTICLVASPVFQGVNSCEEHLHRFRLGASRLAHDLNVDG